MKNFFILSLPRARTAWLSNFLTYGDSFCFHEGLIGCRDMKSLREKMKNTGFKTVGNSDCGNILFYKDIVEEFPDAKFVFIHRDRDEVLGELGRLGLEDNGTVDMALELLFEYKDIGYHYNFNSLANLVVCQEIYEYCTEQEFNRDRWALLDKLDVSIFMNRKIIEVFEHMNETIELFKRAG